MRASDRSDRVSLGRMPAEWSAKQLNRQDCNRILPSVSTLGRSSYCCAMTCRLVGELNMEDNTLVESSFSATINAPIENVDIPSWCFTLPESEHQSCSPAHCSARRNHGA